MKLENIFKDANSIKIWQNYFKQVAKAMQVLDSDSREETAMELQDHLYNSFKDEKGTDEVSRLLAAIEKLGEPHEFLKPVVSDKLLQRGTKTLSPKTLLTGLAYKLTGGIGSLFMALLFGTGYLLTFIFGLMSFAKFLFPENVGLFRRPDESWSFGILKVTEGATELLGYWIVPLGLLAAFILYFILTQLLKFTLKKE
ncbi:MAG: hypothetical protein D8M58_18645 [Calditrichaeota bacterium]|nr:MAG: hypothetical protein DWQ03_21325 [Calditrichota bacterium]MBL1207429.1 hypothetical protein [Calditrichota bacterium]NOG47261.1 hypothetical protein [Calditrichota bacterium]